MRHAPAVMPFKAWKFERARQLRISVHALEGRLYRGTEAYPQLIRHNMRVLDVPLPRPLKEVAR